MNVSYHTDAGASSARPSRHGGATAPVSRRAILAASALSALMVLGACDGDNLFSGDSPTLQPRIVEVAGPGSAVAGDTIGIRVTAAAPREVTEINFSVSGAFSRDTLITIASPASQVTELISLALPTTVQDSILVVQASAVDRIGAVSRIYTDTVIVVGPPAVQVVGAPDSARVGTAFTFTITASGGRPISTLLVSASGAFTEDQTITISPSSRTVSREVTLSVPDVVQDTVLRLAVAARDESGLTSPATVLEIPLAVPGPTLSMVAPASAQPGGRADLEITASAVRKVASLRFELRGAISRDTVVEVNPAAASLTRSISIPIPGDVTDPELRVRAFAVDVGGAVSAPVSATIAINTGAPVVESLTILTADPRGGQVVDVRVVASGVRPLTRVNITFRGAATEDLEFPISPSRNNVTVDASVSLPVEIPDTLLIVRATATDEAGEVSAVRETTVKVRDVTGPTVSSTVAPGSVGSGSTISIRVQAADNVGLGRVGYAVLTSAGDTIGGIPTVVNTAGIRKDTTFTFTVPFALQPGTYNVLGIAFDAAGLRGISSLQALTVVDSGVPVVNILAPGSGATYPLGDSVLVTVGVSDLTGIKSISMKGIAIRQDPFANTQVVDKLVEKTITFPQAPQTTLPTDTTVSRYLLATADTVSEVVYIVVQATDSLGNVGTDTVDVSVGGPRVTLTNPGSVVQAGGQLSLQIRAEDAAVGLDSMRISVTGVMDTTFYWRNLAPATDVTRDTTLIVANTTGTLTINGTAWNRNGIAGVAAEGISVEVTQTAVADTTKPQVLLTITPPGTRIELDDSITVSVTATDNGGSGIRRMGAVVIAIPDTSTVARDTFYMASDTFTPGLTGSPTRVLTFRLSEAFHELLDWELPRRFTLQAHAFAVDTAGNCGASVSTTFVPSLACDTVVDAGTNYYTALNAGGLQTVVTVTAGSSVALPDGGTIADAVVDVPRQRLYMSNISNNKVDVLRLSDTTFVATGSASGKGLVGAAPWGMVINNTGDTLIVANSGGTNISHVVIDDAQADDLEEDVGRRIRTPNNVLFTVIAGRSNGLVRYSAEWHDFSDRPQFIAQHANGTLLYSTVPTSSATPGTIRFVDTDPNQNGIADDEPEVKLLYNREAVTSTDDTWAVAYIDSLSIVGGVSSDDLIILYDHVPGQPGSFLQSAALPINTALTDLQAKGSDVAWVAGAGWNIDAYALSDTTFVAASGDRNTIAFGEGASDPTGRIILCCDVSFGVGGFIQFGVSDQVAVQDLINNASERVLGLGLNQDGLLGVARGSDNVYYFDEELRLQGQFTSGIAGGGGGAALHPLHATDVPPASERLSFVGTPNQTIKIIDTVHFYERGEIAIRDNITGPLRAYLPNAAENVGLVPGDPNFIVVKLAGVTAGGRVVIVNVREKDINN
ncbi:MAG: hypothetical protein WEB88_07750 [Gemmatimonadota bacterium]